MLKAALLGIAATLAGLIAASVVVGAIETINSLAYPEFVAKLKKPDELRVEEIPTGAIVVVLIGWCAGATVGSFAAALITARFQRRRSPIAAYGFGLLFLGACVANLLMIPHPVWMTFVGIMGPGLLVTTVTKLTLRTFYRPPQQPVDEPPKES